MTDQMCRICLQCVDCPFKLTDVVQEKQIWEALNSIADVSISADDLLPQRICSPCHEKLEQVLIFQTEVENSDKLLHKNDIELITVVKSESESDDIEDMKEPIFEPTIVIEPKNIKNEEDQRTIKREIKSEFTAQKKRKKKFDEKSLKCCMCQTTFEKSDEFEAHLSIHSLQIQLNSEQKYTTKHKKECKYCKQKFRLARSLQEHFEVPNFVEPPRDRVTEYLNKKKRESFQEKERQDIICSFCGKIYSNKMLMKEHELRVHAQHMAFVCPHPGCERRFASKTFLNKHFKIHGERKHVCDICGRAFLEPKMLMAHSYRHKDIKRYQCAHCPRTFTYRDMIRRHVESHFHEKIYRCDQCDKTYKWDSDLKRHIQGAHLGDLPFKCKFCNKGYFAMSSRKYHEDRCPMGR
ncbi:zinc finger protein 62-like [Culicoides brevitarsis]|uniref:zinc finger protein 62-like n=1 Tax=Culicoides brevitarsis TaxID=469753 RepID=UPI00307BFB35